MRERSYQTSTTGVRVCRRCASYSSVQKGAKDESIGEPWRSRGVENDEDEEAEVLPMSEGASQLAESDRLSESGSASSSAMCKNESRGLGRVDTQRCF